MNSAVIIKNLSKKFKTVLAVDNISFDIIEGSVFGFLGPNGAGKTTTIRLLLGLVEPTSGEIEILGNNIRNEANKIREKCGALLEHTGLYERLTAEQNLEYYGRIWGMNGSTLENRIKELLTHFGLWERKNEKIGKWSRGMKQKAAIARALIHNPQLLFLDEPTAGLDPVASAALRQDIGNLSKNMGITVFLTTHNLMEAEKLCNKVAVINKGKIISCGHPDELKNISGKQKMIITGKNFPVNLDFFMGIPEIELINSGENKLEVRILDNSSSYKLVNMLVHSGAEIDEVIKEKATFEEAFLKILEDEDA